MSSGSKNHPTMSAQNGSAPGSNPQRDDPTSRRLSAIGPELYVDFTRLFGLIIAATAILIVSMGGLMIFLALSKSQVFDKAVVLRVMQIAFGNFFGGVCVYLGVVLSWFGVRESIRLAGELGDTNAQWRVGLNTASPGVLLMTGGMTLIAIAMFCRIDIAETSESPAARSAEHPVKNVLTIPLSKADAGSRRGNERSPGDAERNQGASDQVAIPVLSFLAGIVFGVALVLSCRRLKKGDGTANPNRVVSQN